jgi:hypothetical protein
MRSADLKCLLIVVFAAPGWILQEFPDYFDASKLRDAQGNTVPGSNHLISASTTTHLVYVSEQQLAVAGSPSKCCSPGCIFMSTLLTVRRRRCAALQT